MKVARQIARLLPRRKPARPGMGERIAAARAGSGKLARRAWAVTIAGLLAADVMLTATGTGGGWADLVNHCLGQPLTPKEPPPEPAPSEARPAPGEAIERLMGPRP